MPWPSGQNWQTFGEYNSTLLWCLTYLCKISLHHQCNTQTMKICTGYCTAVLCRKCPWLESLFAVESETKIGSALLAEIVFGICAKGTRRGRHWLQPLYIGLDVSLLTGKLLMVYFEFATLHASGWHLWSFMEDFPASYSKSSHTYALLMYDCTCTWPIGIRLSQRCSHNLRTVVLFSGFSWLVTKHM